MQLACCTPSRQPNDASRTLALTHSCPVLSCRAGEWASCRQVASSAKTSFGQASLSQQAASFLADTATAWPASLEDVTTVVASTWCRHADAAAVSLPLYTIAGDETKVAVQV